MTPETIARLEALYSERPCGPWPSDGIAQLIEAIPELLAERTADKREIGQLRFALSRIDDPIARAALEWRPE